MGQHRPPLLPLPPPQLHHGSSNRYGRSGSYMKPHLYRVAQSLPHHTAPHPYRRDSYQSAPAYKTVVERREEVVEVVMEDAEPQEKSYQKHVTAESKKDAENYATKLKLSTEDLDRAIDCRQEFYVNLKSRSFAIGECCRNKTMEDITKHRLELLDQKQKDTTKRREAAEKKPVQNYIFETSEGRTEWLNQRANKRNQRVAVKKVRWAVLRARRVALMTSIKDVNADKFRKLEEGNWKAREEATKRLLITEEDKVEKFTEWAAETDKQACEEQKKAEAAVRQAHRVTVDR